MIKQVSFGNSRGFGNGGHRDEYYYSNGIQTGRFGPMTGYGVNIVQSSDTITGLGAVKEFAEAGGVVFAQTSDGKVFKETNAGQGDFALSLNLTGDSGHGLLGDQKGRILAFRSNSIALWNGAWTSSWKTGLYGVGDYPSDTYEGSVYFGNGPQLAMIDSADNLNTAAFTLPSDFLVAALKAGQNGLLIGANLGRKGYLILWNPVYGDRSTAPWIPLDTYVSSIVRSDAGWLVVTGSGILETNGYTKRQLAPLIDDPLGFSRYAVNYPGTALVNETLFILAGAENSTTGRFHSGIHAFNLQSKLMQFITPANGQRTNLIPTAIWPYKNTDQRIYVAYNNATKNYIGEITTKAITPAIYIAELLADSPTTKSAEAVILNIAPSAQKRDAQALSFSISAKIYNFRRALWGRNLTNATGSTTTIRVGLNASPLYTRPAVGDEVTILEGVNAGLTRHITAVTDDGLTNETWTLDTALPSATENNIALEVSPFEFISIKTAINLTELSEFYFDIKNRVKGKKYLLKFIFESMTNAQLELHPSTFVYDDLGFTS